MKDLGVFVAGKLDLRWQCAFVAQKANHPGLHQKNHGKQGEGDDSALLLYSPETPLAILC